MESLAQAVSFILLGMLVLSVATVVLSILTRLGKLALAIAFVAIGVQAALTVFGYLTVQILGHISLAILVVCLLVVFIPKNQKN